MNFIRKKTIIMITVLLLIFICLLIFHLATGSVISRNTEVKSENDYYYAVYEVASRPGVYDGINTSIYIYTDPLRYEIIESGGVAGKDNLVKFGSLHSIEEITGLMSGKYSDGDWYLRDMSMPMTSKQIIEDYKKKRNN